MLSGESMGNMWGTSDGVPHLPIPLYIGILGNLWGISEKCFYPSAVLAVPSSGLAVLLGIRGQRIMLDFDLAAMYDVETRALNQAVKRNIERFPEDFMFKLTKGEWTILKSRIVTTNATEKQEDNGLTSQIVILKSGRGQHKKFMPYAFTEQGVAMLSSVLRSPLAIQVNIGIIRAFVEFRHMASTLALPNSSADIAQLRKDFEELKLDIEDILHDQNDINESTRMQLENITTALAELQSKEPRQKPRRRIGFIQPEDYDKDK